MKTMVGTILIAAVMSCLSCAGAIKLAASPSSQQCMGKLSAGRRPLVELDSLRVEEMTLAAIFAIHVDTTRDYQFKKTGHLVGSRTSASVMRTVMTNLAELRYEYNKRLRDRRHLRGKITVMFLIASDGEVFDARVVHASLKDDQLQCAVLTKIRSWSFDPVDIRADTSVEVYPFVFSQ